MWSIYAKGNNITWSKSVQVMACYPTAPSHCPDQWCELCSLRSCGIHLHADSKEMLKISVTQMYCKVTHLTHWGRVTHICVTKLTIIGSDNGLPPGRRQAIIWTNAGILLIESLGANFSEILIEILTFSFKKMRFKVSSAKWQPFCLGLNGLTLQAHLSRANVLTHSRKVRFLNYWALMMPYGDKDLGQHWFM